MIQKRKTKTKTFGGRRYYFAGGATRKKDLPITTGFVNGPYKIVKVPYRGVQKHKWLYAVYTKKKQ